VTSWPSEIVAFDASSIGLSKGSLSLALILTRKAKSMTFPLDKAKFVTAGGGQVAGLGGGAVKRILKDNGIERILSSEGGRTSRGNMERMSDYVDVLNVLHAKGTLDLDRVEKFWVDRVLAYFDAMPFSFKLDPNKSLRSCIRDLLAQAVERQREVQGTMYAGAVMQHLVGAKLDYVTKGKVVHHGFSVADAPSNRSGDFLVGDVAIHVTTAPGEALIRKCQGNLTSGLRPIIVTTEDGVGGAKALAKQAGVDDRLDVIEIEQFIATNVYEWSLFERDARPTAIKDIIERYNRIVADCESDPSLRIEFDE
jgi:transposase InsO family protein